MAQRSRSLRRQASSLATASCGPSSVTCAARPRPMDHMVSSAGVPVTVTHGVAPRRRFVPAGHVTGVPVSRASATPVGARAEEQPGPLEPLHSTCHSPASSGRSVQSGGRAPHVLVVHEVLHRVGRLVRAWDREHATAVAAPTGTSRPARRRSTGPGTAAAPARCTRPAGRPSPRRRRPAGVPAAPGAPPGHGSASPRRASVSPGRSRQAARRAPPSPPARRSRRDRITVRRRPARVDEPRYPQAQKDFARARLVGWLA